jgi:hypothetical protein
MPQSNLFIGIPIETYTMYLRLNSPQGFILQWFDDAEKTDPANQLAGKTLRVIIGEREAPVIFWDAVCSGNISTFAMTAEETDLPYELYDGLILQLDPVDGDIPLVNLRIEVGPS